jgi:hypothetical protein
LISMPKFSATSRLHCLTERNLSNPVSIALDMLMYQAVKSSGALSLLSQHALLEDAATISRRLMELAITAAYIYCDGNEAAQASRAARYLVHMWRQLPERALVHIPETVQTEWRALDARIGDSLPRTAKRWGPLWKGMFTDVGAEDLYQEDYTYLSAMAHGSPDDLIVLFSHQTIRVHRHDHAGILLIYGTKYLMIVATTWNRLFRIVPDDEVGQLTTKVNSWKRPSLADAS